jgi:hypothetical protein
LEGIDGRLTTELEATCCGEGVVGSGMEFECSVDMKTVGKGSNDRSYKGYVLSEAVDTEGGDCKPLKGNEFSSKITCLKIYILLVLRSRHL